MLPYVVRKTIADQPVHAAVDARVVATVDGLPSSPPGGLPADLPFEHADGNHVVLDRRFSLIACSAGAR